MQTFRKIIEKMPKETTPNSEIGQLLVTIYYKYVDEKVEDYYVNLIKSLVTYAEKYRKLTEERQEYEYTLKEIKTAILAAEKNQELELKIKGMVNKNFKSSKIPEFKKFIDDFISNAKIIESAPTMTLAKLSENRIKELEKSISDQIIYMSPFVLESKIPLIKSYSGLIRAELNTSINDGSLAAKDSLGKLVVAYVDLFEKLIPKLEELKQLLGTSKKQGEIKAIPQEYLNILKIILTLANRLDYNVQEISVAINFETCKDYSTILEDTSKLILIYTTMKKYLLTNQFDPKDIEEIEDYYKNDFGVIPNCASTICRLSRRKKDN